MSSRGTRGIVAGAVVAALAVASPAAGATTVGQTFTPSTVGPVCTGTTTFLQVSSQPTPAPQYTVPTDGVITSWSHQTTSVGADQLELKVARPAGPGQFQFIGESSAVLVPASTPSRLITTPSRIPVRAGDVIGLRGNQGGGLPCDRMAPSPLSAEATFTGDPPIGSILAPIVTFQGFELDLSAQLEADADQDGYGDETQDGCPTLASTQGPCPVPPDADGDGVPDSADKCPSVAGPAASSGCPTADCDKAEAKLKKAKAKLKKLKERGAPKSAISKAKKKVKKAKAQVEEACAGTGTG